MKTLEEILSGNPFNKDVVRQWNRELDEFNKGEKEVGDLCFLLNEDAGKLKDDNNLHLELLPHPFMGNPNAPIWYLPLNPSYSPIDQYDNLGICPGCGLRLTQEEQQGVHVANSCVLSSWYDRGKDKVKCLTARQKIFLKQLTLPKDASFAFLEKEFDTLGECPDCLDNGGYRWWNRRLFGAERSKKDFLFKSVNRSAKSMGKKLFVLEPFPYHSKIFRSRYFKSSGYFSFWAELVKWGIENGRKFIVRSTNKTFNDLVKYEGILFTRENRIGLKGQNAALTIDNFEGEPETIAKIKRIASE